MEWTEIPKMFGKEFLVGFFLPAALFIFSLFVVLVYFIDFGQTQEFASIYIESIKPNFPWDQFKDSLYVAAFIIGVTSWIFALLLLSVNWLWLRFLEGYWACRSWNPLWSHHKKKFRKKVLKPKKKLSTFNDDTPLQFRLKNAKALWMASTDYPDQESYVLPTAFGNCFRAFEVYSRVVYGIDAIPLWPRLIMVIPENARNAVNSAKMQIDLCVNLMLISIISIPIWIVFGVLQHEASMRLVVGWSLVLLMGAFLTYRLAVMSVRGFGEMVKSSFDLYRADLATHLRLQLPENPEDERKMWNLVSRMMIYRSDMRFRELREFRLSEDAVGSKPHPTDARPAWRGMRPAATALQSSAGKRLQRHRQRRRIARQGAAAAAGDHHVVALDP